MSPQTCTGARRPFLAAASAPRRCNPRRKSTLSCRNYLCHVSNLKGLFITGAPVPEWSSVHGAFSELAPVGLGDNVINVPLDDGALRLVKQPLCVHTVKDSLPVTFFLVTHGSMVHVKKSGVGIGK